MKNMTLTEIAKACGGTLLGTCADPKVSVSGVAIDSRLIEPGYLFVPIKGERVDGHKFIPQVMEHGALCTLSDRELPDADYPYILVSDTVKALQDLAEHYRKSLDITVIGITGSVGKTSTKEMISSILSQKYNVLKTEGNFNNEIGLPLTIFRIREEHEIAVLEMGISDFEEMHTLAKMARPDLAVITNIGPCHLENLGDFGGVLKAKTEIFDYMKEGAPVFLNGDDATLRTVQDVNGAAPGFFGIKDNADYYADNIKSLGLQGTECTLHLKTMDVDAHICIPGNHMVYNALAGSAIAEKLGLTKDEIAAGIHSLVPVSGRNNMIETDSLHIIDDCYNANPISMKASLDVLSSAPGRRVAVLGDMGELGANEKELHSEVGAYAAGKGIDLICCIGELSENTADAAKAAGKDSATVLYFTSKDKFINQMQTIIKSGDTILVKASHFMEFPEIVTLLQKLDL